MDARSEIREFLTSRRAKLKAADVGLPDDGTRRVPGLRREEVPEFRRHWAKHDVRFHTSGVKRYRHAQVGDLQLNYERLELVFDTRRDDLHLHRRIPAPDRGRRSPSSGAWPRRPQPRSRRRRRDARPSSVAPETSRSWQGR